MESNSTNLLSVSVCGYTEYRLYTDENGALFRVAKIGGRIFRVTNSSRIVTQQDTGE